MAEQIAAAGTSFSGLLPLVRELAQYSA